jgi:pimeloyl-ACP methyl ester carboxylesterase
LLLTEPARSAMDLAGAWLAAPWLACAPRGDRHPVLVLPGLQVGDASTTVLRGFLQSLGYRTHGWGLGRNVGSTAGIMPGLPRALEKLALQAGSPVSVIGWSLGGIYGRELARRHTALVRQVITLGSPFAIRDRRQAPVPVPSTAIYSQRDGIVDWRNCIDPPGPRRQNIEVRCSHLGFGHDAATLWVIADRLARPAGDGTPFTPPQMLRLAYPEPL